MKTVIVGGNWGERYRSSSIVAKIASEFDEPTVYNGGSIGMLPKVVDGLAIWMPNIDNEFHKRYPLKQIGTCLIVSKVVREPKNNEHKYFQAVSRIFKMRGNAVIAIERIDNRFVFNLIDALGNIWVSTSEISELVRTIKSFAEWSSGQIRRSISLNEDVNSGFCDTDESDPFMTLVRDNANRIMDGTPDRYFGNCSTRCMSTFPSSRVSGDYLFSPRNVSKRDLSLSDMVVVSENGYSGDRKPSVDTPIQISVYEKLPNINFMIHGHAFFDAIHSTEHYFPCGDMREVDEIVKMVDKNTTFFVLNLKNHGFLIGSEKVEDMEKYLETHIPIMKPLRTL